MKTFFRRCRLPALLATVLVSSATTGAWAEDEETPSPPAAKAPTTRTTQVVSTESPPTAIVQPATPSAPVPALPNADPPTDPTMPADANASSEPPAPSEYNPAADTDPAALSDFRDTLQPYGTWEDDSTYGVVWVPSSTVVGSDFAPYVSHGHWGLSADNSWLWVSDFNWGWAPFHYGRWVWIGGRGWGWIPGRVYSPAWVVWRTGFYDDYYVGWAPMPPTWYWRGGWAVRMGVIPPAPYVFCSASYVFAPHLRSHIAPPARMNLIAPRTRPYIAATPTIGNTGHSPITMTRGPSLNDAHVPVGSVPTVRTSPDARAVSFARAQAPSRSLGTTPGYGPRIDNGRVSTGSYTPRPISPGAYGPQSGVSPGAYGPRPMPPMSGPSVPRYDVPRPMPPSGQTMPPMPQSSPVMPRFGGAPSGPTPAMRPSMPSMPSAPAPVIRPSAPAPVNVGRPNMSVPRAATPAPRGGAVTPRVSPR